MQFRQHPETQARIQGPGDDSAEQKWEDNLKGKVIGSSVMLIMLIVSHTRTSVPGFLYILGHI